MEEEKKVTEEVWDPKKDALEEEIPLEKNDRLAMWIAGMLTIGLPCLILIGLIVLITLLFFTR